MVVDCANYAKERSLVIIGPQTGGIDGRRSGRILRPLWETTAIDKQTKRRRKDEGKHEEEEDDVYVYVCV